MRSTEATVLAARLLEVDSVRKFMAKHDIWQTRQMPITRDRMYPDFFQIPILDRKYQKWVNLFKPGDNPKAELKERLEHLLRTRKGYLPGDIFVSPWGRFLVTDVLGLKEI
jgi:hypothetical protein